EPALSFSIPSIFDEISLDCRIYHPSSPPNGDQEPARNWTNTAVIIAHPYAPLGGCYDVPVLTCLCSVLLKEGVTVGTFNFRGAGGSKGRTTWTGKGELADYESFFAFVTLYLDALELKPLTKGTKNLHIVLGGYSYGSLVVTRLPPISETLAKFSNPEEHSAAAVITTQAHALATETNNRIANERLSRPQNHSLRIGGKASSEMPRSSRENRRIEPYYLLISPLLPPISSLVMFPLGQNRADAVWTKHPTFSIFGDNDFFTSFKKLTQWSQRLSEAANSNFQVAAVTGAGHFWVEDGVEGKLKAAVRQWVHS
ncbi:hypothetical protein NA57DRAFT_20363, partial [Rhizodiscina lignyota]